MTNVTVKQVWSAINQATGATEKKHEIIASYFAPAKSQEQYKKLHAAACEGHDRAETMRLNAAVAYCRKLGTLQSFNAKAKPTVEQTDRKALTSVNAHAKGIENALALMSKAEKARVKALLVTWLAGL